MAIMTRMNFGTFYSMVFFWIIFKEGWSDPVQLSTNDDVDGVFAIVNKSGAVISSPGFPRHYGNDLELVYRIRGATSDVVRVTVTHIDIEGNLVNGCHDKLKIYDGKSSNESNYLRSLCGFSLPSPVYSSGYEMDLVFDTDATRGGTGFQAIVSFVNPKKPVTSPYTDLQLSLTMASVSLIIAIVTMVFSLVGLLMLHRRQRMLLSYRDNLTDVLQTGVRDPATNNYDLAATKDVDESGSTNDDENAPHGYIRMRPSKKHMKYSSTRKFHDDPEMYCEPDASKPVYDTSMRKDEGECMAGTDGEYHEPTGAEYERPSGQVGYEKPSGARNGEEYEQPTNDETGITDENTYYSQETYEAVSKGNENGTGGAECEQATSGDTKGTSEESTYYSKETYDAVSREIDNSTLNAS